ncbi:hypothetical protein INT47_011187 [Mucor saturninus]|uniref:Galactose oxidase n=1 Tax=Mucor saturninus TaxID=64648 RepID=A0A8H7VE04_9FUNG|nr:hypothetical protein INT47_011187 [Mucor saturninus]
MNKFLWVLLTIASNYAMAQEPSVLKLSASCGYLTQKIFCFGGEEKILSSTSSDSMHMIDLTAYNENSTDDFVAKWKLIDIDTKNQTIQPRRYSQSTQLPDGKTLLIVGGEVPENLSGSPQVLSFNGETLSWDFYKNFEDPPYGNRQIFDAASVYVPEYGFVLYGGMEGYGNNNNVSYPDLNATLLLDSNGYKRLIGYTKLEMLDIRNTTNPWRTHILENNAPNAFPYRQAAIFDATHNTIFFFGGSLPNYLNSYQYPFPFKTAITFNLTSLSWGEQTLKGQGPSPRYGHSATVVGPSQRHVLIFGGQSNDIDRPLPDYCYTLDLDSFQWTQQMIPAANGVVLARTRHSAVTINTKTVFMVFGIENEQKLAEKVVILNVTNPLNITLRNTFDNSLPTEPTSDPKGTNDAYDPKNRLTSGAIIGMSVGISVFCLIVIAIIIFLALKKRKNKEKTKEMEKEKEKENESLMEVDWDKAENKYVEDPNIHPSKGHFNYKPQAPDAIAGTARLEDLSNTNLSPKRFQRPSAIDHAIVESADKGQVLKPDIE